MAFKLSTTTPSNNRESADLKQFERQIVEIVDLLIWCSTNDCSDLYIKEGSPPYISRFGQVIQIPCVPTTRVEWSHFYDEYITNERNAVYVRDKMLDTSTEIRIPEDNPYYQDHPGESFRYRTSFGFSENHNIATFRMIRPEPPTFETINYPEVCKNALHKAYNEKTGVILYTGATGSGKTTTLAAVMNSFTRPNEILDNKVIITLEDPIEYTYKSTESVKFSQKELEKDFMTFPKGVKQALREHPNIIIVGEARDKEVIQTMIEAARTGHLVSSSFHSSDVGGTLSRMIFHLDNEINLVYDLILNLNIIMSQKLLKREDRYEVDTQYLLFNDSIREYLLNIIDEGKNIQVEVNKLIKDEKLQQMEIVKDWTYS